MKTDAAGQQGIWGVGSLVVWNTPYPHLLLIQDLGQHKRAAKEAKEIFDPDEQVPVPVSIDWCIRIQKLPRKSNPESVLQQFGR